MQLFLYFLINFDDSAHLDGEFLVIVLNSSVIVLDQCGSLKFYLMLEFLQNLDSVFVILLHKSGDFLFYVIDVGQVVNELLPVFLQSVLDELDVGRCQLCRGLHVLAEFLSVVEVFQRLFLSVQLQI